MHIMILFVFQIAMTQYIYAEKKDHLDILIDSSSSMKHFKTDKLTKKCLMTVFTAMASQNDKTLISLKSFDKDSRYIFKDKKADEIEEDFYPKTGRGTYFMRALKIHLEQICEDHIQGDKYRFRALLDGSDDDIYFKNKDCTYLVNTLPKARELGVEIDIILMTGSPYVDLITIKDGLVKYGLKEEEITILLGGYTTMNQYTFTSSITPFYQNVIPTHNHECPPTPNKFNQNTTENLVEMTYKNGF